MREETFKKITIVLGGISFLFALLSVYSLASFLKTSHIYGFKFTVRNFALSVFFIDAVLFAGLCISSIGLYKLKKWGHIVSNTCLGILLCSFLILIIDHFFPNLINTAYEAGPGWFIFFHIDINFETILVPVVYILFLIILNLRSTRSLFYSKQDLIIIQ